MYEGRPHSQTQALKLLVSGGYPLIDYTSLIGPLLADKDLFIYSGVTSAWLGMGCIERNKGKCNNHSKSETNLSFWLILSSMTIRGVGSTGAPGAGAPVPLISSYLT